MYRGKLEPVQGYDSNRVAGMLFTIVPVPFYSYREAKYYRIDFSSPLKPRATVTIVVDTVYSNAMSPLPREILQDDSQLVKYTANLYHFSPYQTSSEVVMVKLASKNVESYSQIRPVKMKESIITYGPFQGKYYIQYLTYWTMDNKDCETSSLIE